MRSASQPVRTPMKPRTLFFAAITLTMATLLLPLDAGAQMPGEDSLSFETRVKWFRDAKFGMFIHWGAGCLQNGGAGGDLSWSRRCKKPLDIGSAGAGPEFCPAYDTNYHHFNPTEFDADFVAQMAKDAGMKYVVLTAKHHEGFAMWDTKQMNSRQKMSADKAAPWDTVPYSITQSICKRDIVKELSAACKRKGLRFGVYYSPRDWYNTDYGIGDNSVYDEFMRNQIIELLGGDYGTIDLVWWDSFGHVPAEAYPNEKSSDRDKKYGPAYWKWQSLLDLTHELNPNIINNNRVDGFWLHAGGSTSDLNSDSRGDYDTPEGHNRGFKYNKNRNLFECCLKISNQWGWQSKDTYVRPAKDIIQGFSKMLTYNGNLLLNIGPSPEGNVRASQVSCLMELGEWMKKYGEAVYSTRKGPVPRVLNSYGTTCKDSMMYFFIWNWNGSITTPAIPQKIFAETARSLNGKATPTVTQNGAGRITVKMPSSKLDPVVDVIAIKLDTMLFDTTANMTNAILPVAPSRLTPVFPSSVFKISGERIVLPRNYGDREVRVAIYSLNGRQLRTGIVKSGVADLRREFGLNAGVYIVRIVK